MWTIHRNRPDDDDESVRAVKDAVHSLAEVDRRDPEVRRLAQAFRSIRTENHFSDKIEIIMGGR